MTLRERLLRLADLCDRADRNFTLCGVRPDEAAEQRANATLLREAADALLIDPAQLQTAEGVIAAFLRASGRERFPIYGSHYGLLLEAIAAGLKAASTQGIDPAHLRGLIERWRGDADESGQWAELDAAQAYSACADDLDALLAGSITTGSGDPA